MIRIVSLVGPPGSGKSTLAEGITRRLDRRDIGSRIVKKDTAQKEVSREQLGDEDGIFSWKGAFGKNRIHGLDVHARMNREIRNGLALGQVVILEGGTRTRSAMLETLDGIDLEENDFMAFFMDLPFREVRRRLIARRETEDRFDDSPFLQTVKLLGMYGRTMFAGDALRPEDDDVIAIDATLPQDQLADLTTELILDEQT